jgi:hypothetical protein
VSSCGAGLCLFPAASLTPAHSGCGKGVGRGKVEGDGDDCESRGGLGVSKLPQDSGTQVLG